MRAQRERGVALVEFALLLPFMLILTFSVTEIGRAYYQYNTIAKSVREAARYLSVRAANTDVDKARNIVVYGNSSGSGNPLALGLSLSNVPVQNISWSSIGSYPTMNAVTVKVSGYQFVSVVSSVFGLSLGTINFGDIQATMRSPS